MTVTAAVVSRIQGGLGNQLFCYAYGRAVAGVLGRRLLLDISELERGDSYGRTYQLGDLGVREAHLSLWWLAGVPGRLSRRAARAIWPRRMVVEPAPDPESLGADGWIYLDGYWQHEPLVHAAGVKLRRELGMGPISDDARQLGEELQHAGAIGMHIRFYGEEKVAARRSCPPVDFYQAALDRLVGEFGERPIYVASDDPDRFAQAFPRRLVEKVVSITQPTQYEDFALLRHCRYHVLSNSSFGWWGAFLADSRCAYYPENRGYFHYAAPAPGWRLL